MKRSPRDRRDLEEIAQVLFSGAAMALPAEGGAGAGGPGSRLIALWACGDPELAAHLATALAAPNSGEPGPKAMALGLDRLRSIPSLSWSDPRERTRLASFEQNTQDVIVLLEGKEGPLARTIALCASEHLLVFDATHDSRLRLAEVVSCLYEGSASAPIGIVLPEGFEIGELDEVIASGSYDGRRKAETVGAWRPGQPLPRALTAFLAQQNPPPQSLLWAWDLCRG